MLWIAYQRYLDIKINMKSEVTLMHFQYLFLRD